MAKYEEIIAKNPAVKAQLGKQPAAAKPTK